jgi:hypothetical protein
MLWLLACTADPKSTQTPATDSSDSSGNTVLFERPAPQWTAEEVESRLISALAGGVPDPVTLIDSYFALIETATTPDCPTFYGNNMEALPGCRANDWYWGGVAVLVLEEQQSSMVADFYATRVNEGTGETLTYTGGGMTGIIHQANEEMRGGMVVTGTWGYPESTGWLQSGISVNITVIIGPDDASPNTLNGALGIGDSYMSFLGMELDPGACAPAGTLQLRDPSGYWYDLAFDASCGGCVEVFWGEESLGQSCQGLSEGLMHIIPDVFEEL